MSKYIYKKKKITKLNREEISSPPPCNILLIVYWLISLYHVTLHKSKKGNFVSPVKMGNWGTQGYANFQKRKFVRRSHNSGRNYLIFCKINFVTRCYVTRYTIYTCNLFINLFFLLFEM